jgi:SAM-dependent methyltransferase
LAIIEFECDRWQEIEPRNGQLIDVYRNLQSDYLNDDYFKYYDGKHDYKHSFNEYFSANYVVDMFEAVWGVLPPYSLLDAGSANGMTLAAFARKNINAWGIENSPYIHSKTPRKWRSRNLLGDIVALPFADHTFDFIYETCLCYVAECDVDRAIRELSRVTRQGLFFGSIVREMGNGTDEDWEDTFYGIKTLLNLREWSERFLANGFQFAIASPQILAKVWKIEKQENNGDTWYSDRESMRYCFYIPCWSGDVI